MKKFLFLAHRYPKSGNSILEKDMVKVLSDEGHKIVVVVPIENDKTELYVENSNVEILYVKTPRYVTAKSIIEKGIGILKRPYVLKREIEKKYKNEKFDFIVGYTPFMANPILINKLKKKYSAKTLLFLWDIFPQNAKDLGIIKNSLIFKYFKYSEKKMYDVFDEVICNCQGAIEYIKKEKLKNENNLHLIRNIEYKDEEEKISENLREKYKYADDDIISIFGGNMGIPQELDNILNLAKQLDEKFKFILIGTGTEQEKIKKICIDKELKNIKILDFLPRRNYEEILQMADITIISLNKNYTVPNFPAKVTGYIKKAKPIFASLDKCSKKFLGSFLEENFIGVSAQAGNIEEMKEKFLELIEKRKNMKKINFEKVYESEFSPKVAYKVFKNEIFKEE